MLVVLCGWSSVSSAQELEPGAYAVAPVGVNVVVVANVFSFGDIAFDPSGPIDEAQSRINGTVIGYGRTLNLGGRSGQIAVAVPIVIGHVEGRYLGEPAEVTRSGVGDARVRMAINLYGAPAMDRATFVKVRPRRVLGASITVGMPTGPYSTDRLINVGANRWAFKPELGFSSSVGRWTTEVFGGVWFFTKNDPFYRGSVKRQAPIGSTQFHMHYAVSPRLTFSANANFYFGGRTTLNDEHKLDLQRNSRVGVTMVKPLPHGQTLRVAVSGGAYTTIGADFTSLSVSWQRAW
jgi:hypothetical protein